MKPYLKLAETTTPDGARLTLHEHDGAFCVRVNGQALMDSTVATSEGQIGELATDTFPRFGKSRVLIGGLGLGFTLRSALEGVGPHGVVEVAELVPAIVEWNRTFLKKLNGALVGDKRVALHVKRGHLVGEVANCNRQVVVLLETAGIDSHRAAHPAKAAIG